MALILAAGLAQAGGEQTIYYPSKDAAVFTITAAADWVLTKGTKEGDYFNLTSNGGSVVFFRTVAGVEKDLRPVMNKTIDHLILQFGDFQSTNPISQDLNGLKGFYATGAGTNKEDSSARTFRLEWYLLKNGQIAEIWYAVDPIDQSAATEAYKILNSLKAP